MTTVFEWTAEETLPPRAAVRRLQGLPDDGPLPPRIAALVDEAEAEYRKLAAPRAVVADISAAAFAEVYRGDGANAPETPLEGIYPRAGRLALFAATLGAPITARIRELFARRELAQAAMLDAVASAGADYLADLAGRRYLQERGEETGAPEWQVVPYSPGYCGWDVTGQRALFAYLHPERIGIVLNPSCLMEPLKSVSGVLVAGPAPIHVFRPAFPFCAGCRDKPCLERMRHGSPRRHRRRAGAR